MEVEELVGPRGAFDALKVDSCDGQDLAQAATAAWMGEEEVKHTDMTEPFELVHASAPEALGLERSCREHRADVSLPGKTNGCAAVEAMIRAPFGLWWQYVSHFSPSRHVVDRRGRNGRRFFFGPFDFHRTSFEVRRCGLHHAPGVGLDNLLSYRPTLESPQVSTLLEECKHCPGRSS